MPSKFAISRPLNGTQRDFNELCERGGGQGGGPARGRVQQLLRASGQRLNVDAHRFIKERLADHPTANPWHVCFAVGLAWGHLAKLDPGFVAAAVDLLADWNDADLKAAKRYPLERGPGVIEDSLRGGWKMFEQVRLPDALPTKLDRYRDMQMRWLNPIVSNNRPRYIGSWNACAMFMVALFSNPGLSAQLTTPKVLLPPGGPIYKGLSTLHSAGVLGRAPDGTDLDDSSCEPGAIYNNNELMADILVGLSGWNLTEVHSGLYMLGTRLAESDGWF